MELKPMIYTEERKANVLAHDTYKGYEFAIISLGTHPCAYIGIPEGHRFYKKESSHKIFDDLPVHWGLTYSEMGVRGLMQDKWVIGWDYAHCVDYVALSIGPNWEGRRWSTEEILEEVKAVIDEIVKEDE